MLGKQRRVPNELVRYCTLRGAVPQCRDEGAAGKRLVSVMAREAQATKTCTGQLGSTLAPCPEPLRSAQSHQIFPRGHH